MLSIRASGFAIIIVQLTLVVTLPAQESTSNSGIVGVWSSGTLEQGGTILRPECPYLSVTERKVSLKAVTGTNQFQGEWVRWTRYVWMASDGLKCRWYSNEEQFEPILGSSWTFKLVGTPSNVHGGVLKVSGSYDNCLGNGCDVMPLKGKTFETELKLVRGTLVDTNATEDPSDDLAFIRLSDEAELVDDARGAAEAALKLLDRGQLEQFYNSATSTGFRSGTSIDQFKSKMAELQSRGGFVGSRNYLMTTAILYAPMLTKDKGEYVLFSNKIVSTKHFGGVEFVFLIHEQAEWKVYWFNYGS